MTEPTMSAWTHAVCDDCYFTAHPDETPHRLLEPTTERCCACGAFTDSGIYVRADPETAPCGGVHL